MSLSSDNAKDVEIPSVTEAARETDDERSPTLSEASSKKPTLEKANTMLFPVKPSSKSELKSLFSWSTDIDASTADDQIAKTFRDASIDLVRRDLAKKMWFRVFLLTTFLVTAGEAISVGFLPRKVDLGFQYTFLAAGTALQAIGIMLYIDSLI